jgi:uncharacterized NAD(P)/FAD-binding protein YdhS
VCAARAVSSRTCRDPETYCPGVGELAGDLSHGEHRIRRRVRAARRAVQQGPANEHGRHVVGGRFVKAIYPIDIIDYPGLVLLADDPAGQEAVIAIVGGGASGTLAALYLLREAASRRTPLRIALIDRHGRHGLGQAYATTHPAHLLNSPVDAMSVLAGDLGHLARWAAEAGLPRDGFLPRGAYGRYLTESLAAAERSAWPAARVTRITAAVVAIRRCSQGRALRLHLAADGRIDADAAVLATGNLPPVAPSPVPAGRYIADPWEPGALDALADGSPVAVLGTGLSMLDVAIALTGAHPRTTVHAVSRHALLPREHRWPRPAAAPVISLPSGMLSLTRLIRDVRATAAGYPGHWQDVVDAIRPQIPGLWAQLPAADQRLFLCHVARYWEIHRHRVPPETARRAAALTAAGRLSVHRGRVIAATAHRGGLRVRLDHTDADLAVGWLVNCTGPASDITATADPLLRHLLDVGLARPDPLGLGLDADPHGAVRGADGRPARDIFTLGPLLRGSRYETTAIPEIRDQAATLARHLLASHPAARPGSAA